MHLDVELKEGHADVLGVAWNQESCSFPLKRGKARIEIPDGVAFALEANGTRQVFKPSLTPRIPGATPLFGIRPASNLETTSREFEDLERRARELGKNTVLSSSESSEPAPKRRGRPRKTEIVPDVEATLSLHRLADHMEPLKEQQAEA